MKWLQMDTDLLQAVLKSFPGVSTSMTLNDLEVQNSRF